LKILSFQIEATQRYAITGRNGSGKSTLLKAVLKQYDPTLLEEDVSNLMSSGRIKIS